jgi:hypothetical protein
VFRPYDCLTRSFAPAPLQRLHRSYGSVRPSALHRYSRLTVFAACASPLPSAWLPRVIEIAVTKSPSEHPASEKHRRRAKERRSNRPFDGHSAARRRPRRASCESQVKCERSAGLHDGVAQGRLQATIKRMITLRVGKFSTGDHIAFNAAIPVEVAMTEPGRGQKAPGQLYAGGRRDPLQYPSSGGAERSQTRCAGRIWAVLFEMACQELPKWDCAGEAHFKCGTTCAAGRSADANGPPMVAPVLPFMVGPPAHMA